VILCTFPLTEFKPIRLCLKTLRSSSVYPATHRWTANMEGNLTKHGASIELYWAKRTFTLHGHRNSRHLTENPTSKCVSLPGDSLSMCFEVRKSLRKRAKMEDDTGGLHRERKIGLLKNVNVLHFVLRGWHMDFPTSEQERGRQTSSI
jgi:hypothetical protein